MFPNVKDVSKYKDSSTHKQDCYQIGQITGLIPAGAIISYGWKAACELSSRSSLDVQIMDYENTHAAHTQTTKKYSIRQSC